MLIGSVMRRLSVVVTKRLKVVIRLFDRHDNA